MDLEKEYKNIYGKDVSVKDIDGQTFVGYLAIFESAADSDDGTPSITLTGTMQYPNDYLELREDEIKSIKVLDD